MTEYALTHGQYLKARRIKTHRPGASVRYIALHVGATEAQIRHALDIKAAQPASVPRDKKALKRLRPGLKVTTYTPCGHRKAAGIPEMPRMVVPHEVLVEREKRMALAPPSLTAALLGDPLPGHREYLDSLAAANRRRA
jgi:hypothetical protein